MSQLGRGTSAASVGATPFWLAAHFSEPTIMRSLIEHGADASFVMMNGTTALHAATASQAPDGGLGDAVDVVAQHLAVALGAALAEAFASLATSRHDEVLECIVQMTTTN